MGKALTLIAVLLISGCGHMPVPVEDPRAVWCEHNQPRRPTPAVIDTMSRPELDEMNAHNWKGVEWCGWKP